MLRRTQDGMQPGVFQLCQVPRDRQLAVSERQQLTADPVISMMRAQLGHLLSLEIVS